MTRNSKPSQLWYLLPIFFGIVGGLIGYIAVRDQDKNMARNIIIIPFVIIGIVTIVVVLFGITLWGLTPSTSPAGIYSVMMK